jgi:peptidoglycan biosynthesis protein MviN/MurJ (putative lipid II flippase)
MPDQRYNKKRIWTPVVIGAVALVSVIAADTFIRYIVGGDLGKWLGAGVDVFVVYVLSWIVARKFSNPTNRSLCVTFGTLLGAGIGREAARHFLGGAWNWELPIGVFGAFVVGVPLKLMIMRPVKSVANPAE